MGVLAYPAQRRVRHGYPRQIRARLAGPASDDANQASENENEIDAEPQTQGKEPAITRRTIPKTTPASLSLLKLVEKSLDDDKAENAVVIPLSGKTDFADYMVVATGTSQRHIGAMAQHLRERIKDKTDRNALVEGDGAADWVLLDAGDVVVHLFRAETRAFYAIEKLWVETPADRETKPASAGRHSKKSARAATR